MLVGSSKSKNVSWHDSCCFEWMAVFKIMMHAWALSHHEDTPKQSCSTGTKTWLWKPAISRNAESWEQQWNSFFPFFCTNIGPCLKPAFSYTKGYRAQANSANFREPIDAMKGCHLGSWLSMQACNENTTNYLDKNLNLDKNLKE